MDKNEIMDVLDKLEEKAIRDLRPLAEKPDINPAEWAKVKDVLCLLKTLKEYSEYSDTGYSNGMDSGYSSRRSRYSTNRYMGRGDYNGSMVSRGGYSQHSIKDRMIANLEKMMDDAKSEYEREQIHDEIVRLEMEK